MSEVFDLIPKELIGKKGNVPFSPKDAPLFAIYFSAHWCPPCQQFTPILGKFYEAVNKKKKQIEIIFVSADRDEDSFKEYFATMPWVACKFDQTTTELIASKFELEGIPTLLVFNQAGELICKNATGKVASNADEKGEFTEEVANSVIEKILSNKARLNVVEILPKELLGKKGNVPFSPKDAPLFGIYFSAHWCGPCRGFTPILGKFYEAANKKKKQIEIIFVSSDRDEDSFNEYFATMPWVACKFDDKETKEVLDEKFNVEGIPTFLVFNQDGEVIDKNGRRKVQPRVNEKGEFTEEIANSVIDGWINPKSKKNVVEILPKELLGKKGNVPFSPKDAPLFGIYFSAHWCPPCRGFTPILGKFYEAANKKKKQIEIIFVSSDRDEDSFNEYFATMPWVACKFDDKETKEVLDEKFNVEGIPTFLVFDQEGNLLDNDGRGKVQPKAEKGEFSENVANSVINEWLKNAKK